MNKMFLFLIFLMIFSCKPKDNSVTKNYFDGDTLSFEVVRIDTGWGYKIYKNEKVFINQELIPAIKGKFLFKTPEDAAKTALLVISKMNKKVGLPALTVNELDSLGVLDSNILNFQNINFGTKEINDPKIFKEGN